MFILTSDCKRLTIKFNVADTTVVLVVAVEGSLDNSFRDALSAAFLSKAHATLSSLLITHFLSCVVWWNFTDKLCRASVERLPVAFFEMFCKEVGDALEKVLGESVE